MSQTPQQEEKGGAGPFRSGYVAIAGQPNVGKSTLINRLMQFKLSITTPKPQTTRHRIMGILTAEAYQIVFLDTPGLITPSYRLQEVMMETTHRAAADADLVLFMVTAAGKPEPRDLEILADLAALGKSLLLGINKIDLVEKTTLLPFLDAWNGHHRFAAIIPFSARSGENCEVLLETLVGLLPAGAPFYDRETLTEHPERFFVSEIIREKIFAHYGEEIPYSTAVIIDEFKEGRPGRKDVIKARIVVERQTQKGIIIGKGGAMLRKLGEESRLEIEAFLERPVFLELWVTVRDKWRTKDTFLREFGYQG
ncbi:MAG TPA: GTPase Era [bacterium]|nr:GTPase Era [bacterium]HQG45192.1 GTPase Era [bacterium]HQI48531.1 GTPase Era [bacterium]HQJ64052.1 GTPase Era [bacterium]